ncbi:MAG: ABC transporter ATP-binding protein [Bacillota bacterium]
METQIKIIDTQHATRVLLWFAKPYLLSYFFVLALFLILSISNAASPYFMKLIVDEAIGHKDVRLLMLLLTAILITEIVRGVSDYLKDVQYTSLSQRIIGNIRHKAYANLTHKQAEYLTKQQTGDTIARLEADAAFLDAPLRSLASLLAESLTVIVISVLMVAINWRLYIVLLISFLVLFVVQRYFGKQISKLALTLREQIGKISAFLQESVSGMAELQLLGQEVFLQKKYQKQVLKQIDYTINFAKVMSGSKLSTGFIGAFALVFIFGFGSFSIFNNQLTIGGLMAFNVYFFRLFSSVSVLAHVNLDIQSSRAVFSRLSNLLEEPDCESSKETNGIRNSSCGLKGELEFNNVSFSYPGQELLIKDLSFKLNPGEFAVVQGPNGAGKTTIANLVVRKQDVSVGSITLGGKDLRLLPKDAVRRHVSIVPQEPFIIHGSIYENLCLGNDPSPELIDSALNLVGLREFVSNLSLGINTQVGERGCTLSSGQRQRLAIARALLRKQEILILDESTSALDYASEEALIRQLKTSLGDRILIVVTHRLALAKYADKVIKIGECSSMKMNVAECSKTDRGKVIC